MFGHAAIEASARARARTRLIARSGGRLRRPEGNHGAIPNGTRQRQTITDGAHRPDNCRSAYLRLGQSRRNRGKDSRGQLVRTECNSLGVGVVRRQIREALIKFEF